MLAAWVAWTSATRSGAKGLPNACRHRSGGTVSGPGSVGAGDREHPDCQTAPLRCRGVARVGLRGWRCPPCPGSQDLTGVGVDTQTKFAILQVHPESLARERRAGRGGWGREQLLENQGGRLGKCLRRSSFTDVLGSPGWG